jgi:putative sensory transduction regulator
MTRWNAMTSERCRMASVVARVERGYACLLAVISRIGRRFHANPEGPSRQEAMGQSEPVASAPAVVAPPDAPAAVDTIAQIAGHLAYQGYEISHRPDGWSFARHTGRRYTFALRVFADGIRLHCSVNVGRLSGNSRIAWLDFLNSVSDRSYVTRFALVEEEKTYCVRMRAWISGAYSRAAFATAMDMWHDDSDLLQQKPEAAESIGTADTEVAASVTVH